MSQYTSISYLPGHFVKFFNDEKVACSWKSHSDNTVMCFFEAPLDEKQLNRWRNLLFLEYACVVTNLEEARALADHTWKEYWEQILAGDGERVYVRRPQCQEFFKRLRKSDEFVVNWTREDLYERGAAKGILKHVDADATMTDEESRDRSIYDDGEP